MVKPVQFFFHNSAVDLRDRFYRRFPDAPRTRWDLTSIKSRWNSRLTSGRSTLPLRRRNRQVLG